MKSALRQGIFLKNESMKHTIIYLNKEPLQRPFEIIIKTADNDDKNVRAFAH